MTQDATPVLLRLQSLANPDNVTGMAKFGINPQNTLGISIYELRKIAKEIGTDHVLAQELWRSGVHEARILAGFIADSRQMDEALLESWVTDIDSWDVCDQVCDLFSRSDYAYTKPLEWAERSEEFVKRAGFVIMAHLAVYDKQAPDEKLAQFFPVIVRHATDERNFVKKAVNWALRNIGKRNRALNAQAIACGEEIRKLGTSTARWIATDAIRELSSEKVQNRLKT